MELEIASWVLTLAMVLQSLWLCPSNNPALIILPTNNRIFRRAVLNQNQTKCSLSDDDKRDFSSSSSRRDFVLLGGLTSLSLTTCVPFSGKFLFLLHLLLPTIETDFAILSCSGSCWRTRTRPKNGFFFRWSQCLFLSLPSWASL